MEGLCNLNARLAYQGGNQEQRFQKDKLNSLRKALLYSYQAETLILPDGREFRCLINPDKLKEDYDVKILSIPYEDICLNTTKKRKTTQGFEPTNIAVGQVVTWKETNTKWLVYLQHLEEDAYFRASLRQCSTEIAINEDSKYWVYLRGPVETSIPWKQKAGISWNDINYTLIMYITKNEETLQYFHRFTKVQVPDELGKLNTWEVQAVDAYSIEGIIQVNLREYFNNSIQKEEPEEPFTPQASVIEGPRVLNPYDVATYTVEGISGGEWKLESGKAKIVEFDDDSALIEVLTGKSGSFTIEYAPYGSLSVEIQPI